MTSRLLVMEDAAPQGCHRLSQGPGLMIRLIELGPDQQAGPGMHGIVSSAIQQALRGAICDDEDNNDQCHKSFIVNTLHVCRNRIYELLTLSKRTEPE